MRINGKCERKKVNLSRLRRRLANWKGWDFLYPPRCPSCDNILPWGQRGLCEACHGIWKPVEEPYCLKCGKALAEDGMEYCMDCRRGEHFYTRGRALYEYPQVRDSLYRFKYKGRREYGDFYGEEIAARLGEVIAGWQPQLITAVPLHRSRRRRRGYNQAAVIAEALGAKLSIPVDAALLKRVRKTRPQKELTAQERQNNLKRAFKIRQNDVKLSTIIIIDDIYTTGSTIDEAALTLRKAGVEKIYFITLAIGLGR